MKSPNWIQGYLAQQLYWFFLPDGLRPLLVKEVCQDLFTPSLETACTNEREKLAPANLLLKNSLKRNPSCSFDICASINKLERNIFICISNKGKLRKDVTWVHDFCSRGGNGRGHNPPLIVGTVTQVCKTTMSTPPSIPGKCPHYEWATTALVQPLKALYFWERTENKADYTWIFSIWFDGEVLSQFSLGVLKFLPYCT